MSKRAAPKPPNSDHLKESLTINVLESLVRELEETKLKLLLNIKELKQQLIQQKEDQADIYYFLNKKCDESFEVIASLEEQILNEQADREIAEKLYENKIEELKNNLNVSESRNNDKIADMEGKLELLSSYHQHKEESERNLERLMKTLEEERTQFSRNAEAMENSFLMEREKLRKSYDLRYDNIKKELESSMDGKLTKKTKKTQIMNIIMKKELDNQSKHAEKLLEVNENLLEKDRQMQLDLGIAQSLQKESLSRLTMYQRTIRQSNEKIEKLERLVATMESESQKQMTHKADEIAKLEAQINLLQKRLSRENSKMDDVWTYLSNSFYFMRGKEKLSISNHEDHNQVLVHLVKAVVSRYPNMFTSVTQPGTEKSNRLLVSRVDEDQVDVPSDDLVGSLSEFSLYNDGVLKAENNALAAGLLHDSSSAGPSSRNGKYYQNHRVLHKTVPWKPKVYTKSGGAFVGGSDNLEMQSVPTVLGADAASTSEDATTKSASMVVPGKKNSQFLSKSSKVPRKGYVHIRHHQFKTTSQLLKDMDTQKAGNGLMESSNSAFELAINATKVMNPSKLAGGLGAEVNREAASSNFRFQSWDSAAEEVRARASAADTAVGREVQWDAAVKRSDDSNFLKGTPSLPALTPIKLPNI